MHIHEGPKRSIGEISLLQKNPRNWKKFTSELGDGRTQIFPYSDSEALGIIFSMR